MLKNMKIAKKLIGGFVLVAAIAAGIGVVGWINLKNLDAADTRLFEKATAPMKDALAMATLFQRIRVNARDAILAENSAEAQKFIDRTEELAAEMKKVEANYATSFIDDQDKKNSEAFSAAFDDYWKETEEGNQLALKGKDAEAAAWFRRAMSGWPRIPEPAVEIARFFVSRGETSGARLALAEALRRQPGHAPALEMLAALPK